MSAKPRLVVGLGNPGPEYDGTRHNVGFAVLDGLAEKLGCSFRNKWRFSAEVAEAAAGEAGKVTLAKPRTFMNHSGSAVQALLAWLKIEPGQLVVVVDDADLPLGQIRLRSSGGSGGHNGLRSIIEALGGEEGFARLRVGIGRTAPLGTDITNHVLGRFATAERTVADEAVATAVEAMECSLREGWAEAMNRFNRKKPRESGEEGD
ncbi:MAG TPA: aminoacyl-tRNA hydrolase [Verrucomicrobiae bacterium]|nr:aminoacyl-tRNA hydrolase [Verrucomicrobiae bacterium]